MSQLLEFNGVLASIREIRSAVACDGQTVDNLFVRDGENDRNLSSIAVDLVAIAALCAPRTVVDPILVIDLDQCRYIVMGNGALIIEGDPRLNIGLCQLKLGPLVLAQTDAAGRNDLGTSKLPQIVAPYEPLMRLIADNTAPRRLSIRHIETVTCFTIMNGSVIDIEGKLPPLLQAVQAGDQVSYRVETLDIAPALDADHACALTAQLGQIQQPNEWQFTQSQITCSALNANARDYYRTAQLVEKVSDMTGASDFTAMFRVKDGMYKTAEVIKFAA